jgi:hypothetical protein
VSVRRLTLTALLAVVIGTGPVGAQAPSREEIVSKATDYVHEFIDRFANVVAEERYEQEITVPRRKRVLVSDFLLVRYPGETFWQAFRDVAEVDGKPVRDREERITKLFLEPSSNALRRAAEIAGASSRHNLLDVGTLNQPLLALAFLQRQYMDRFRFTLAGLEKKLGPNVRTVRFEEFRRPTVLKGNGNSDVFSRGLYWIEESTGRVVKTELQLGTQRFPVRIATTYAFDEALGINVPTVMEDWYSDREGEFRGKATYGRFRRFEVKTEESVK